MKSVKEIADYLNVSQAVVYRLIESHLLSAHRIGVGRGTLRISEKQLQMYLDSTSTESLPAPTPKNKRPLKHLKM